MRFPSLPGRGLGVGLDMPWSGARGFGHDRQRGDLLAPSVRSFLGANSPGWAHAFFSWQPRDRAPPRLADYVAAWDDLAASLPPDLPRALHHTALNLGALDRYRRDELLAFTTALCERYQLRWINEDVGLWSLAGRPLPYPLPPLLTDEGLRSTVANVRDCQSALPVPLVLEFPGFARGVSVVHGDWHAYDFFRALAEETDAPVTLDIGHLLSYQWWRGRRGADLFDELERLPLAHCFEIHLSGCEIVGDHFVDAHHGNLLDEQLILLRQLLFRCPNLRAVTFEDPRFDESGALLPENVPSWRSLLAATRSWATGEKSVQDIAAQSRDPAHRHLGVRSAAPTPDSATPDSAKTDSASPDSATTDSVTEATLGALLYDHRARAALPTDGEFDPAELDEAAAGVRRMVRERMHRGTGGLTDWFPRTLAAWRAAHPGDDDLAELLAVFCAGSCAAGWRELPGGTIGISLEEALYRFFEAQKIGDPVIREEEFVSVAIRALAVTPRAWFVWPSSVHLAPGGCFAVTSQLILHAALAGRYHRGPVTPLVAALLSGEPADAVAKRFGIAVSETETVETALIEMKLLATL